MKVRELEHRPAIVCLPSSTLREVAALMEAHRIGSVVVSDETGALRGIVTDRDIVVRGIAHDLRMDAPVADVMTPEVEYIYENADVFTAAGELAESGIRRLPVLDEHGHLSGVVTLDDLLIASMEYLGRLTRAVSKEVMQARIG